MKRQPLSAINKRLLLPLLVLTSLLLAGAESIWAEDTGTPASEPEYTDFYNTDYYYKQFKTRVESEAAAYDGTPFDENIDCTKAALGIGINFGNELDWSYGSYNDFPSRQRRYEVIIEVGNRTGSEETVYYTYTQPFNAQGNLYTYENRQTATDDIASIKLRPTDNIPSGEDPIVNFLRVKIKNDYYNSWGKPFTVNVRNFELTDGEGNDLIGEDPPADRYGITIPKRYNDPSAVIVFDREISTTVGALRDAPEIKAHIQLENFVSDYVDNAELTAVHADNMKMSVRIENAGRIEKKFSYEQLDKNLQFLKEEGIKTIRLPLTWYCHMDSSGKVDPEWFALVNSVVDRMIDKGFYVIVNIHSDTGRKSWIKADKNLYEGYTSEDGTFRPGYKTTYKYLCLQIADNFKDFDHHLIIQGPNEVINYSNYTTYSGQPQDGRGPITKDEYGVMNELNQIFVDEMRRAGHNNTNRILLCNTYYSARLNLPDFELPKDSVDNKILVGIHDYTVREGGLLSSLEWFNKSSAPDTGDSSSSGSGAGYLKKYNIIMDEFGIYKNEAPEDASVSNDYLEKKTALMTVSVPAAYKLKVPMILWDEGSRYAVMKKDQPKWDEAFGSDQVAAEMLQKYKDNAPAEHDWLDPVYQWSDESETCEAKIICSRDGDHIKEKELVQTTQEKTDSTCTKEGSIKYTAAFESSSFTTQKKTVAISPKGHEPDEPVMENIVEPACDIDGSYDEVVYCSTCGAELIRESRQSPATGHDLGQWTMLDNSRHQRVCSRDEEHVEYEDHRWDGGKIIKTPTYTSTGLKEFSCQTCGGIRRDTLPVVPYPPGADPGQKGSDGTPAGPGASAAAAEKAILTSGSDEGPAGSRFAPLMLRSTSQKKTSVKLTWNKVSGGTKYIVYGNACGRNNKMKKLGATTGRTFTVKKINRTLKKGTYHKFMVVALNSRNSVVSTSKVIHVATKGGKVGNYRSVKLRAKVNAKGKKIKKYRSISKIKLKRGATVKIKSTVTPASKNLKVRKHRAVAFVSSNPKVASVTGGGKIRALSKGNCYIYAYAQNGVYKRLKISVR